MCGADLLWQALPDGSRLIAPDGRSWMLERVLGQGGFGITYLAHSGQDRVAIKECFPDGLVSRDAQAQVNAKPGQAHEFVLVQKRFLEEARLLAQLEHPASTLFLASWQANNTAYLMMEYLEGETLEARIARRAFLTEAEARQVMISVLSVLEVVHARNLLHRDIKPANVMLTGNGTDLIDFGSVAKFDPTRSTQVSHRLLTPAYAPLELYSSSVRLGPSSDLYSLTATIYEAISGVRVPSALDRVNGHALQRLEDVSDVSSGFADVLAQALELRVADRFSSVAQMRAALQYLPPTSQVQTPQPASLSPNPLRPSVKPTVVKDTIILFGVAFVISGAIIGVWMSGQRTVLTPIGPDNPPVQTNPSNRPVPTNPSDLPVPTNPGNLPRPNSLRNNVAVFAWMVPVNTFHSATGTAQLETIGFVVAAPKSNGQQVYGPLGYQVIINATTGINRLLENISGYGDLQTLPVCCDFVPGQTWNMQVLFDAGNHFETFSTQAQTPKRFQILQPPSSVRVRLNEKRDEVLFEFQAQPEDKDYWLELQNSKGSYASTDSAIPMNPMPTFIPGSTMLESMRLQNFMDQTRIRLNRVLFDPSIVNPKALHSNPPDASAFRISRFVIDSISKTELLRLTNKTQLEFKLGQHGGKVISR